MPLLSDESSGLLRDHTGMEIEGGGGIKGDAKAILFRNPRSDTEWIGWMQRTNAAVNKKRIELIMGDFDSGCR